MSFPFDICKNLKFCYPNVLHERQILYLCKKVIYFISKLLFYRFLSLLLLFSIWENTWISIFSLNSWIIYNIEKFSADSFGSTSVVFTEFLSMKCNKQLIKCKHHSFIYLYFIQNACIQILWISRKQYLNTLNWSVLDPIFSNYLSI